MRKFTLLMLATAGLLALGVSGATAQEQSGSSSGSSGAAASDPTSSVNSQDFKYKYFDLTTGSKDQIFEAEGNYAFNPRFKINHKLVGVHTNRIGKYETDFKELSLKPIFLTPGHLFGIKTVFAVGGEWIKDLGDVTDGTGSGSDKVAPLAGVAWKISPKDTVITLG